MTRRRRTRNRRRRWMRRNPLSRRCSSSLAFQAQQQQVTSMADYSRITAPFSGVVTWRYADTGALIQAGTSNAGSAPVVKIADISTLRLRLPVPESLAAYVHDGDTATIYIDALDRTITGKVARSTDALDPSTRTMQ